MRAMPEDRLKMQNNPSAVDAKFNEKKIILTGAGGQGKIIHSRWRRGCHHLSTIPVDNLVH
ncbi:hypothetical protein F3I55_14270 [Pantoea sp. VH_24]|nr:hypothetical protein F3I55_14270 [Pantoea sp. VH_24]KAA5989287.1 hypothetical protein F3I49_01730 [Pantoea sp. M_4]